MKIVTVPKLLLNPIPLPGMGRSIEVSNLTTADIQEMREAYARNELFVEFSEEPGNTIPVKQLWANPHAPQVTLFV